MIPVLVVLCVVFAGIFLYMESRKQYVSAVIFKGLASACFVMIGAVCSPGTQMAALIVYGLIAGGIADVLVSLRKIFKEKAKGFYLAGILAFFTGHILYLAAIFPLSSNRLSCIVIGIILTALLMTWIFKQITAETTAKILGLVYIGVFMVLNCAAVSNLITTPSVFAGVFAAGAALFLVSDALLILNTFGKESSQRVRSIHIIIYYAGQLLIALSLKALA